MRKTKEIKVGNITIGNNHPVIIQSMTLIPKLKISNQQSSKLMH